MPGCPDARRVRTPGRTGRLIGRSPAVTRRDRDRPRAARCGIERAKSTRANGLLRVSLAQRPGPPSRPTPSVPDPLPRRRVSTRPSRPALGARATRSAASLASDATLPLGPLLGTCPRRPAALPGPGTRRRQPGHRPVRARLAARTRSPRSWPASTRRRRPGAPGHRGVDLAGHARAPVRAALAGTVGFAGTVAGRGVVVVDHGAPRTTYEPVAATVRAGDRVAAGDRIGRLQLVGSHCLPRACLHWGLRVGDAYRDPLTLVGPARCGCCRSAPLGSTAVRRLPQTRVAPGRALPGAGAITGPAGGRGRSRRAGEARAPSSGAGMSLAVGLPQPVVGHVGVDLRGGQRGVPEQLLHGAQVRAALEQMCRGGVSEPVRTEVRAHRGRRRGGGARRCARRAGRPVHRGRPGTAPGPSRPRRARPPVAEPGVRGHARPAPRTGTVRSLRPLPSTRTTRRSRSTSSTSRPHSSPTRMPVA